MFNQFKPTTLLLAIILLASSLSAKNIYVQNDSSEIDSIHKLLQKEVDSKLIGLKNSFRRQMIENEILMDSLHIDIELNAKRIHNLSSENKSLYKEIEETQFLMESYKRSFTEENRKLRQVMYISGPTILFFLLLSIGLFSLIITRQQNETDMKISALRKYAHNEIEISREVILKKFRKRVKKLSQGFGKKKNNPKAKSKKAS
jgi:hypothetical protein